MPQFETLEEIVDFLRDEDGKVSMQEVWQVIKHQQDLDIYI